MYNMPDRISELPPTSSCARADQIMQQAYNRISPVSRNRPHCATSTDHSCSITCSATDHSQAEQRARQYEALLEQQRNIQAQMNMIDPELRREVDEARKLEQDINHFTSSVLHEPGSPPNDHPTFTNRFSTPSLASPGVLSHLQSQVTSPPSTDLSNPYFPSAPSIPSQSMPASQRNSDHEESDEDQTLVYRPKAGAKYVTFANVLSQSSCLELAHVMVMRWHLV